MINIPAILFGIMTACSLGLTLYYIVINNYPLATINVGATILNIGIIINILYGA